MWRNIGAKSCVDCFFRIVIPSMTIQNIMPWSARLPSVAPPADSPLDLSYDRVSSNQSTLYFQSPLPAMYQSEYPVASSFAWLSILLKSACYIEWHTVCNKPCKIRKCHEYQKSNVCGFHACPDEVFLQALERQILFLHNRKQFAFENLKIKQNDSARTKYPWPWKWIGCINCLKTN